MANGLLKAVVIGIATGMRSFLGPALVSRKLCRRAEDKRDSGPYRFLADERIAVLMNICLAGELIADKTPWIMDRTDAMPLAFRAVSGAVSGAAICQAEHEDARIGALAGGIAALASAHACFQIRRSITKDVGCPDAVIAVIEDAVALAAGHYAVSEI